MFSHEQPQKNVLHCISALHCVQPFTKTNFNIGSGILFIYLFI